MKDLSCSISTMAWDNRFYLALSVPLEAVRSGDGIDKGVVNMWWIINSSKSRCQLSRWVISHSTPLISAVFCTVSETPKYSILYYFYFNRSCAPVSSEMSTEEQKVHKLLLLKVKYFLNWKNWKSYMCRTIPTSKSWNLLLNTKFLYSKYKLLQYIIWHFTLLMNLFEILSRTEPKHCWYFSTIYYGIFDLLFIRI